MKTQKLMTKALENSLKKAPLYSTDGTADKMILAKFFHAYGSGTWYLAEYDAETGQAFGYVEGLGGNEWGYFNLNEMQATRATVLGRKMPFQAIERDAYFTPKRMSELNAQAVEVLS